MKYQYILWDWNGTLFNDTAVCHDITNEILREIKVPEITLDFYRKKLRHPIREFYNEIVTLDNPYSYEWFADRFHQAYEIRRHECGLHAHAEECITFFKSKNAKRAILSAHPQSLLNTVTMYLNLTDRFDYIIGAADNLATTKFAEGKRLMQLLSADPKSTLIIGDTHHDADVAKELGIDCILVSQGMQCKTLLEPIGVPLIDKLSQLLPLVRSNS